MSAIEQELQKATSVKPKPKERRQKYLQRLVNAGEKLDPKSEWPQLSDAAQKWVNDGIKADEAGKDILDFSGAKSGGEAEAEPKPKKGAAPKAEEAEEEQPEESEAAEEENGEAAEDEQESEVAAKTKGKTPAKKTPAKTPAKAPAKTAAKGNKVEAKAPAKQAAEAKAPAKKAANGSKPGTSGDGYKGHRAGSRKEKIHQIFDDKGADAAKKKGEQLGLSTGTLNSWCASFKKQAGTKKGAAKAAD